MSAVADVLNGAADLIEREGWCQGHYRDDDGCYCVAGAIDVTLGILDRCVDTPENQERFERLWSVATEARRLVEHTVHAIPTRFNDAPGRTQAEVVAALRAAARNAA